MLLGVFGRNSYRKIFVEIRMNSSAIDSLPLSFWKNRSVFLTGHTGFKGSWLSVLLTRLGAQVHGFSLSPPTTPSVFEEAHLSSHIASSTIGDIRDRKALEAAFIKSKATIGFHLAAQPMVLSSYEDPFETYDVNVSGTVSFLDVARKINSIQSCVVITTDKCYENKEWNWPYRETDTLGGHDPYSNSKACCELVVHSFQKSFFLSQGSGVNPIGLATARAGNIIGGGDWGKYRLLPDFFRAYKNNETLSIRNPDAVRPWQHVLEPLMGYCRLAQATALSPEGFSSGWNFGPDEALVKSVREVIETLKRNAKTKVSVNIDQEKKKLHEAQLLRLDCSKARNELGWRPVLNFDESIDLTLSWYERWMNNSSALELMQEQVELYLEKII